MKKTWIAILFSIIFPGLGHLYLGETKKGGILIGLNIVATLLSFILIGVFVSIGLIIYSIYDVYKLIPGINTRLKEDSLK
ncbi:sugar ABC transporter permease [Priestia sp. TGN 0903]|uniref:sugar ABC transporter permease n=1 Tax=Priestia sp. TGN 0903 TaxID=3420730 RepID=UPI003D76EC7E